MDKEGESDQGGDGIAGKTEEVGPSACGARETPEDYGLSRLDLRSGKEKLGAEFVQRLLNEVKFAHRDTAGEDNEVGVGGERRGDGGHGFDAIVAQDRQQQRLCAALSNLR